MWKAAKARWDELATASLFSTFGVIALLRLPNMSSVPTPFSVLFDVELILAGLFIIIGILLPSYTLRILGYALYVAGLLMLGGLLFAISKSPFALLALAFAIQGIAALRVIDRDRKARRNIAILIETAKDPRGE